MAAQTFPVASTNGSMARWRRGPWWPRWWPRSSPSRPTSPLGTARHRRRARAPHRRRRRARVRTGRRLDHPASTAVPRARPRPRRADPRSTASGLGVAPRGSSSVRAWPTPTVACGVRSGLSAVFGCVLPGDGRGMGPHDPAGNRGYARRRSAVISRKRRSRRGDRWARRHGGGPTFTARHPVGCRWDLTGARGAGEVHESPGVRGCVA
jgi:hypothetical protein